MQNLPQNVRSEILSFGNRFYWLMFSFQTGKLKSVRAFKVHCQAQRECTCRLCSKVFCESNALERHRQQQCEQAASNKPNDLGNASTFINCAHEQKPSSGRDNNLTVQHNIAHIAPINIECNDDKRRATESDTLPSIPNLARKMKQNLKAIGNSYDCYLCHLR